MIEPMFPELLSPADTKTFASTKLQVERRFGPCSKCESHEVSVRYHAGGKSVYYPYLVDSCQYTVEGCGKSRSQKEHLLVTCDRCRFSWKEGVSSAASL